MWSVRSRRRLAWHAAIRCFREPGVVGAVAHRHARLCGDEDAVAASLERLADELLGQAGRVDVGGVDQVDARVEAAVDLAAGAGEIGVAGVGEDTATAKRHRPHRQR